MRTRTECLDHGKPVRLVPDPGKVGGKLCPICNAELLDDLKDTLT